MDASYKIFMHALIAAAFFFCLQRFVLGESVDVSVIWAIAGGGGAAFLAYVQRRRGD